MRSRRYELSQRPPNFTTNPEHPWVAKGELVFAGLGNAPGGLVYHDSSRDHLGGQGANHGALTLMDPPTDWVWDTTLNRWTVDYDGSNDYVTCGAPLSLDLTGPISLAAWIKPANVTGDKAIISKSAATYTAPYVQYRLYVTGDDLQFAADIGGTFRTMVTKVNIIQAGVWQHVAASYDGTWSTLYCNGVNVASANTYTGAIGSHPTWNLWLGNNDFFDQRYAGAMADPIVQSCCASVSEIQKLADPSNVMLSGLILPPRRRLWAVASGTTPTVLEIPAIQLAI